MTPCSSPMPSPLTRPEFVTETTPLLVWQENGQTASASWRSANGTPAPKRVQLADDRITADAAYRLVCEGTALLWRGDFQNARQLLQALGRRHDRKKMPDTSKRSPVERFHLYRQAQAQRARLMGSLLIEVGANFAVSLRRAPDFAPACREVYGEASEGFVTSLRELQGLVGAHEWRKKGVPIPALDGAHIHPYFGVFSPIRGEYLDLVARAPLPPEASLAFDIGTGTGVLAAILAKRGVNKVVATELSDAALTCARDNLNRLGLSSKVSVKAADLYPEGKADIIICNPPWLPGKASSALEAAVYDPDSRMLCGFLKGLAAHLNPGGEGWLILSNLAENLGLREIDTLNKLFVEAGLLVVGRLDARPQHGKVFDATDPLHAARKQEVTTLWRLVVG